MESVRRNRRARRCRSRRQRLAVSACKTCWRESTRRRANGVVRVAPTQWPRGRDARCRPWVDYLAGVAVGVVGAAAGGGVEPVLVGANLATRNAPLAASTQPNTKGRGRDFNPPSGGCTAMATMVFTMGAPAKTMGITAAAAAPLKICAAAPRASTSVKAPIAPAPPAMRLHWMPPPVKLQFVPRNFSSASVAKPINAYAMQTNRNALRLAWAASGPIGMLL